MPYRMEERLANCQNEPLVEHGTANEIDVPPTTSSQQPLPLLSKNQQKKQARRQRMLEGRQEKRRLEKEKKKAKRVELMKLREQDSLQVSVLVRKTKLMSESDNKFKVVIDMDFEEYMTDDEIAKAAKQVNRIYALNRHSPRPFQLFITSLKGKILDRFRITNAGFLNWDINHSEDSYLEIFSKDACQVSCHKDMIYLTADTDATLPQVDDLLEDESKIFIIGGLVDHNRHKSLCFKRAEEHNIRTAKLPIREHVQLSHRHVLSTVTVFEILLNALSSKMEWQDALVSAIPKRKLAPIVGEKQPVVEAKTEKRNSSNEAK